MPDFTPSELMAIYILAGDAALDFRRMSNDAIRPKQRQAILAAHSEVTSICTKIEPFLEENE